MIRVALILRGESFRLGSQYTTNVGSPESVEEQIAAAESHVKLCRALQAAGFNVDIYFVTVGTPFTKHLYDIYGEFLKDAIILKKRLPTQNNMIQMAVNMVPIQTYDSVILSRIDLIYKVPLIQSIKPMLDKVQFIGAVWYKDCVTPRGAPRMNDMLYIFPRQYYTTLQQAQVLSAYGHNFLDVIPLKADDYSCISELFFDSDSEKDKNSFYRIANRPEATIFHSPGKTFPADFPPPK